MKKLIFLGAVAGFLLPLATLAQSNLDGTWKVDMNRARMTKPLVILFQDGVLKQDLGFPGVPLKADGQYYPVSGDPRIDAVSLTVVDDRHLEVKEQKNGRIVSTTQIELSPDSNTTTETLSDSSTSTTPVTEKVIFKRVASAPPGSSPFSGSWLEVKVAASDSAITFTFATQGDSVHLTTPTGYSYTAKVDGTEAPFNGDPGVTVVSLKRIDPNTYEETDKLGDQVVYVAHMTVAADGKTMSIKTHNFRRQSTYEYVAVKQ